MPDHPTRVTAPFLDVAEAFLAASGQELHGWAIIKASGRGGPTVYKILERMASLGWLTSRWDDRTAEPNKPRRRYYKLTGEGVARAQALVGERRPVKSHRQLRPAFDGGDL
jgi:DNA-binding PadR family transcriptional regulator